MTVVLLLVVINSWVLNGTLNLEPFLRRISGDIHNSCNDFFAKNLEYYELYRGLICASNIESWDKYQSLKSLGLIHLIVVSGSHLIFLKAFCDPVLDRLKISSKKIFFLLFLLAYCFLCQFSAPVTRAYFAFLLHELQAYKKWGWNSLTTQFVAGLVCLLLFPNWWGSHSLTLSWMAALIHSQFSELNLKNHILFFIFFNLLLLFAENPWSILSNYIFLPIFGIIIFPLTLILAIFFPIGADALWGYLLKTLDCLSSSLGLSPDLNIKFNIYWFWTYLTLFYIFLFIKRKVHST